MKLEIKEWFPGSRTIPVRLEGETIGVINAENDFFLSYTDQIFEGLEIPAFIRKAAR